MTKVKPQRINANNSPQAGYVPKYVDEQTFERGAGGGGGITSYTIEDGTMDGTTPVVISHPQIELDTPFNIYFESEPVGNITRTLGAGTITIVSDDPADTMNFRLVIFGFGNKTTYIQSEVITLDGAGPRVISDSRISADTPVNLFPLQEPTGYLTIVAGAGEVTISSSASETNLEVRYIGFTELSVGSILNDAYGVDWATDETNGASRKAIYDKIEEIAPGGIISGDFTDNNISDGPLYAAGNGYGGNFYSAEYTPTENKLCIMELAPINNGGGASCSLEVKIGTNRTTYDNIAYNALGGAVNKTYFSTILVKGMTYRSYVYAYNSPDNGTIGIIKRKNI